MDIKKPRAKRYGWFRLYNDFAGNQKWRAISRNTKVPQAEVEAIVLRMLIRANSGKPRGNISGFSCEDAAADIDIELSEVVKVYQALEMKGWIDREYLVKWDDRQPDKEDPTNAERQERYRNGKQKERGVAAETRNTVTSVTAVTNNTQDLDTDSKKKAASVTKLSTGQTVTWKEAQEAGYVVPRQRSLPLMPVAMPTKKKEAGR